MSRPAHVRRPTCGDDGCCQAAVKGARSEVGAMCVCGAGRRFRHGGDAGDVRAVRARVGHDRDEVAAVVDLDAEGDGRRVA